MRLHTRHGSILVDVRHRLKLFICPDASNTAPGCDAPSTDPDATSTDADNLIRSAAVGSAGVC